jgi:putative transposase
VYSRYVVGWMVAHRESATLAQKLIAETCAREGIAPGQLTIHADRGSSMTSKPVAFLLADLGVTKTHSRPHVSNDNPYSEAQFRTLKYRPEFPDRFGEVVDARAHCKDFFDWSNNDHHHSALGMLTPADVHHGLVEQRVAERQRVYDKAFAEHPERFPHGRPIAQRPPREVWINKPNTMMTDMTHDNHQVQ